MSIDMFFMAVIIIKRAVIVHCIPPVLIGIKRGTANRTVSNGILYNSDAVISSHDK